MSVSPTGTGLPSPKAARSIPIGPLLVYSSWLAASSDGFMPPLHEAASLAALAKSPAILFSATIMKS
jgi:hypothetical protein